MIGLKRGIVTLSLIHSKIVTSSFIPLKTIIGQYLLDIQHIGSTAITDMIAKPIIDIVVAIHNFRGFYLYRIYQKANVRKRSNQFK